MEIISRTARSSVLAFAFGFLISCAHNGPCSNTPQRPSPSPSPSPTQSVEGDTKAMSAPTPKPTPLPSDLVEVFKYTGEQQCGMAKAIPIEEMQKILESRKITVFAAHTQNDGMMHMALCGAPSGTIHVFVVPKKQVKRALRVGFRIWMDPSKR